MRCEKKGGREKTRRKSKGGRGSYQKKEERVFEKKGAVSTLENQEPSSSTHFFLFLSFILLSLSPFFLLNVGGIKGPFPRLSDRALSPLSVSLSIGRDGARGLVSAERVRAFFDLG